MLEARCLRLVAPPLDQDAQSAVFHAGFAVDAQRRIFTTVVGNKDQVQAAGGQLVQQAQIAGAAWRVQPGAGLVQQQNVRPAGQSAGQEQAAQLSGGKLADGAAGPGAPDPLRLLRET